MEDDKKTDVSPVSNKTRPIIPEEQGNPDCPVCLNRVSDRAYTNTCLHEFCHACIDEWSREHNQCPVCRQVFTKILFNIKSSTEYEESPVAEPPSTRGFMLVIGENAILATPANSGLYLANPIATPHGISYNIMFLLPNRAYFLSNIDPRMMIVPPDHMEHFLQNVGQLESNLGMNYHGRHAFHRHARHNHDRDKNHRT